MKNLEKKIHQQLGHKVNFNGFIDQKLSRSIQDMNTKNWIHFLDKQVQMKSGKSDNEPVWQKGAMNIDSLQVIKYH